MFSDFGRLPKELLANAKVHHHSYYWRVNDIPEVIKAAGKAGLRNIGGSLFFFVPPDQDGKDAATCEPYWVRVSVDLPNEFSDMPWDERVKLSALETLKQFEAIKLRYDFMAEGISGFKEVEEFKNRGGRLEDVMYFEWGVEGEESFKKEEDRRKRPPEKAQHQPPRWP